MSTKKLNYSYIKEQFEKENYKLLTKYYVNAHQKLDYICPIGHRHEIAWHSWKRGQRCRYCGIKRSNDSKRLDPNFVRDQFEKKGYKLLSVYKDSKTKLKYLCPKGHYHQASWNNWHKQGGVCPICAGMLPVDISFVRQSMAKEGYVLLTTEYKNNQQRMEYICPVGHKHGVKWTHWLYSKSRCPYCAKCIKLNIKYIREEFAKEGYTLLSKKYKNAHTKLSYICDNGHEGSTTWGNWNSGRRCMICRNIKYSGPGNHNWNGGSSFEPYCQIWLDKEFKKSILERDNHQCQNPDCWKIGSKLMRHHIDYNKKNCDPSNIITVCNSCNSRANANREYWIDFYQGIMRGKKLC